MFEADGHGELARAGQRSSGKQGEQRRPRQNNQVSVELNEEMVAAGFQAGAIADHSFASRA